MTKPIFVYTAKTGLTAMSRISLIEQGWIPVCVKDLAEYRLGVHDEKSLVNSPIFVAALKAVRTTEQAMGSDSARAVFGKNLCELLLAEKAEEKK